MEVYTSEKTLHYCIPGEDRCSVTWCTWSSLLPGDCCKKELSRGFLNAENKCGWKEVACCSYLVQPEGAATSPACPYQPNRKLEIHQGDQVSWWQGAHLEGWAQNLTDIGSGFLDWSWRSAPSPPVTHTCRFICSSANRHGMRAGTLGHNHLMPGLQKCQVFTGALYSWWKPQALCTQEDLGSEQQEHSRSSGRFLHVGVPSVSSTGGRQGLDLWSRGYTYVFSCW